MSIENISISIDPSPLVNIIKTVIRDEMQPTLYGNDNSIAQVVNEEIDNNPRVHDRVLFLINQIMDGSKFNQRIDAAISDFFENGYSASSVIARAIDYKEIADNIDAEDVASHLSPSRIAAYVHISDIANEISVSDVAEEMAEKIQSDLDYTEIANNIQLADLASEIDVETLMDKIDYRKLAKALLAEFAAAKTNA